MPTQTLDVSDLKAWTTQNDSVDTYITPQYVDIDKRYRQLSLGNADIVINDVRYPLHIQATVTLSTTPEASDLTTNNNDCVVALGGIETLTVGEGGMTISTLYTNIATSTIIDDSYQDNGQIAYKVIWGTKALPREYITQDQYDNLTYDEQQQYDKYYTIYNETDIVDVDDDDNGVITESQYFGIPNYWNKNVYQNLCVNEEGEYSNSTDGGYQQLYVPESTNTPTNLYTVECEEDWITIIKTWDKFEVIFDENHTPYTRNGVIKVVYDLDEELFYYLKVEQAGEVYSISFEPGTVALDSTPTDGTTKEPITEKQDVVVTCVGGTQKFDVPYIQKIITTKNTYKVPNSNRPQSAPSHGGTIGGHEEIDNNIDDTTPSTNTPAPDEHAESEYENLNTITYETHTITELLPNKCDFLVKQTIEQDGVKVKIFNYGNLNCDEQGNFIYSDYTTPSTSSMLSDTTKVEYNIVVTHRDFPEISNTISVVYNKPTSSSQAPIITARTQQPMRTNILGVETVVTEITDGPAHAPSQPIEPGVSVDFDTLYVGNAAQTRVISVETTPSDSAIYFDYTGNFIISYKINAHNIILRLAKNDSSISRSCICRVTNAEYPEYSVSFKLTQYGKPLGVQ